MYVSIIKEVTSLNNLTVNAGLTCGLFTKDSVEVPCPDSAAGLYIRTRDNRVVKVASCKLYTYHQFRL
jgi:hypothetical protein